MVHSLNKTDPPWPTLDGGAVEAKLPTSPQYELGYTRVSVYETGTGTPSFRDLAHTGDSVPLSAGRDIRKFDSEAATWVTPTHTTPMVGAAAAAAARAMAGAIKEYCIRRLADNYVVQAVDAAPPLVPRPGG